MPIEESYRILLANEWRLTDLYEFPHAYSQNYAFLYCLDSDLSAPDRRRIDRALENYPWRGGYSYVNIYVVLENQVPSRDRPRVKSISKSSPGWLELFLNYDVAIHVAKAVGALAVSAATAAYSYKNIQKYLGDINIDRRRRHLQGLQITQAEARVLTSMCTEMARFLGFKSLRELHERTGSPEITLKLLLAHYRRISKLLEYHEQGKARLPLDGDLEKL
jgi:hypothetical protein